MVTGDHPHTALALAREVDVVRTPAPLVLAAGEPLSAAIDALLSSPQKEFPVVDEATPLDRLAPVLSHESAAALVSRGGTLVGIVSRYDLMREMIGTR